MNTPYAPAIASSSSTTLVRVTKNRLTPRPTPSPFSLTSEADGSTADCQSLILRHESPELSLGTGRPANLRSWLRRCQSCSSVDCIRPRCFDPHNPAGALYVPQRVVHVVVAVVQQSRMAAAPRARRILKGSCPTMRLAPHARSPPTPPSPPVSACDTACCGTSQARRRDRRDGRARVHTKRGRMAETPCPYCPVAF